ncbi:DMT family transporter [Patescibacteria group bacterium]|nr:DMT family transporter [Patescibacteria group bacterium]
MNKNKGYLLVLGTAIISGVSIFVNQFGVKIINSDIFAGLKNFAVAGILLCLIFWFKEWKLLAKLKIKEWGTLVLIGLVGGSIPFLLFFRGLSLTSGSTTSFVHKTMFLYVIILAALFLKEKINKNLVIGASLLLFGNMLLLKIFNGFQFGYGEFLVLIATVLWAAEQIISKKALENISPKIVAWGRMFFGFLFIFIFWAATGQVQLLGGLGAAELSWVWITAVFLLGYVLTWYSGLKYIKVSTAVCILSLGAPITSLLEMAQKGIFDWHIFSGSLLMFFGVAVVLNLISKFKKTKALNFEF